MIRRNLAALLTMIPLTAAADYYPGRYLVENAFPALTFTQPLQLLETPSGQYWVLERAGRIRSFDPLNPTGTTTVLDITAQTFLERDHALMAMALDPDFATNRHFYVHYSWRPATLPGGLYLAPGRISRFTVDSDTGLAPVSSELVILEVDQPFQDHNGGNIEFGPDGMLYIALGDGGSVTGAVPPPWSPMNAFNPDSQDPYRNAQNTENLLGKILRIDVHGTPDAGLEYRIPPDNPFYVTGPAGANTRKEIYAYGLRNPWRIAFHPDSGRLYAADVGAKGYEEINRIEPGGNYGWSVMEGPDCFRPAEPPCAPEDFEAAIVLHNWSSTGFRSITGGYVWKDARLPALDGLYLYSDWLAPEIWAMRDTGTAVETINIANIGSFRVAGFGLTASGEVLVLGFTNGIVYRLILDPDAPPPTIPETRVDSWSIL